MSKTLDMNTKCGDSKHPFKAVKEIFDYMQKTKCVSTSMKVVIKDRNDKWYDMTINLIEKAGRGDSK